MGRRKIEGARAFVDRATARPLVTVALLGAVVAAMEAIWIIRTRPLGSFDIDEAGYLASALRFERNLLVSPRALAAVVGSTENGPLTPLLSVPFLLVGPRSATTAMMVQPVLHVVCAVAVAGICRHLGGSRAALLGGVVTLAFPAAIVSAHSYQFGLATGASLVLAVWALVASDRGHRRWPMVGFGLAVGALLLARTMTLGLVPGLAVATMLEVRRDRRALGNLSLAGIATLVVAAPWWIVAWPWVSSYLLRNGYGNRSQYWGRTTILGRIDGRFDILLRDFKPLLLATGAIAIALTIAGWVQWRREHGSWRSFPPVGRHSVGIAAVVVMGYAALLSTSNSGSWFDVPVELLLIALVVGVAARLPPPRATHGLAAALAGASVVVTLLVVASLPEDRSGSPVVSITVLVLTGATAAWTVRRVRAGAPSWRSPLAAATATLALSTIVVSNLDTGGFDGDRDTLSPRTLLIGGIADVQAGNFEADARLKGMDVDERRRVSAEWAHANRAVVGVLQDYVDRYGQLAVTTSGSGHLMSINTILLSSELAEEGFVGFDVPDTTASVREIDEHLTPTATDAHAGESRGVHEIGRRTRILLVIRGRSLPFPDDRQGPRFERLAARQGWRVQETLPLPDGGDIVFYDREDRR